jgi:hypothetical protein
MNELSLKSWFCARQILVPLGLAIALTSATTVTLLYSLHHIVIPNGWQRYTNNPFCHGMALVWLTTLYYGLIHWLGQYAEKTLLHRPDSHIHQWLNYLSGRDIRHQGHPLQQYLQISNPNEVMRNKLLIDEYFMARRHQSRHNFAPIQFGLWVLPLLGFIGTVIGISEAIAGLEQSVSSTSSATPAAQLTFVLGGLKFAFDTTLIGLVLVIPLMPLIILLRAQAHGLDVTHRQTIYQSLVINSTFSNEQSRTNIDQ